MTKQDILRLIERDSWMMEILKTVQTLNLPDWWIGAGFVRGKVWDTLHGYEKRTPIPDIDVIYFDKNEAGTFEKIEQLEKQHEQKLRSKMSEIQWSVKNQARMHILHKDQPYKNSEQGLAQWVETATCIGVKLDKTGNLKLTAPHGIDDLVNLILRPTQTSQKDVQTFHDRIEKKQWLKKWPKLSIEL